MEPQLQLLLWTLCFLIAGLTFLDWIGFLPSQIKTHLSHFKQLFSEDEKTELLSFPDSRLPCDSVYKELLGYRPTCTGVHGHGRQRRSCKFAHLNDRPKMSLVRLLELLSEAKKIDLCIFRFTLEQLASFMIDLKKRGVKIRIITDSGKEFNENSQIDKLRQGGIEVREKGQLPDLEERKRPLMHNKYVIINDTMCLLGSFNWTYKAAMHNHETVIKNCEAILVDPLRETFEQMWKSLPK